MIFKLCKWHFDINWYKFEKRWANFFKFTQMQSILILSSFVHVPFWLSSVLFEFFFSLEPLFYDHLISAVIA